MGFSKGNGSGANEYFLGGIVNDIGWNFETCIVAETLLFFYFFSSKEQLRCTFQLRQFLTR